MTTTSSPETGPQATGPVTLVDGHGPGLRASDADRHATVARLQEAVALGLLTHEEGSERMAIAYDARYLSDLPPLTADLPQPAPAAPVGRAAGPGWRALSAMVWVQLHTLVVGSTGRPSRRRLAVVGGIAIALVVLLVLGAWSLDGLVDGGPRPGGFRGR